MRNEFLHAVHMEVEHAYAKHGRDPWGRHEFYAILKEEVDELWDAIKRDEPTEEVLKELVQVASMCLRYAETGDRYRGAHPPIPTR
jgi:NTP pyrophosphatase (non-canonical NTP hydrolase)